MVLALQIIPNLHLNPKMHLNPKLALLFIFPINPPLKPVQKFWYSHVFYGMYETYGHVESAYKYVCGVYANALYFFPSKTMAWEWIIFCVPCTYMGYLFFWFCGVKTEIPRKSFCVWWHIFNTFLSTRAVYFCTTHGQNKTSRFDNKGFIPVAILCGVVCPLSWFTKFDCKNM